MYINSPAWQRGHIYASILISTHTQEIERVRLFFARFIRLKLWKRERNLERKAMGQMYIGKVGITTKYVYVCNLVKARSEYVGSVETIGADR